MQTFGHPWPIKADLPPLGLLGFLQAGYAKGREREAGGGGGGALISL